jgi:hypothetical protein
MKYVIINFGRNDPDFDDTNAEGGPAGVECIAYYQQGNGGGHSDWTTDVLEAHHYPTKADAEGKLDEMLEEFFCNMEYDFAVLNLQEATLREVMES